MIRILASMVILGLCLFQSPSFGQGNNQTNIIPPSPEVYQFAKYGNVPIDPSSGAMTFQLPLFTIKLGGFSMPLSLGYYSNGVRVDDMGASNGIDWTLNATGVITRVIRGMPDGQGSYFSLEDVLNSDTELAYAASSPGTDTERDWFIFNFNGYSGSFYLDTNMKVRYICDTKLKFEAKIVNEPAPNLGGDLGVVGINNILTFKVTTPDGSVYEFGGQQYAERNLQIGFTIDNRAGYTGYTPSGYQLNLDPVTTYYLKSITTHNGAKIIFEYLDNRYKSLPAITQHAVIANGSSYVWQSSGKVYWRSFVQSKILRKILVKQPSGDPVNTIEFLSSKAHVGDRFLISGPDSLSLTWAANQVIYNNPFETSPAFSMVPLRIDSIVVKDWVGNRIQSASLLYDNALAFTTSRQYLKTVAFKGIGGTDSLYYGFEYKNAGALPLVLSSSQDYYGYYNGKINQGLVVKPALTDGVISSTLLNTLTADGIFGDREPVANFVSYGMLSKIIYPTKGYTEIEYEPNYNEYKKLLGGARVKNIRDYDGAKHTQSREFYYHALLYYPAIRSSLIQTNEPRFFDRPQTTITGQSEYTLSSTSINTLYNNRRSNQLYGYVTEIFKDEKGYATGAVERTFASEPDPAPQVIQKDLVFSVPSPNINSWKSGMLINQKKFTYNKTTSQFELQEETKNVFEKFNELVFTNHVPRLIVKDMAGIRSSYSLNTYQEIACDVRKTSDTLINYSSTGNITKHNTYVFSADTMVQVIEVRDLDSKNNINTTKYTYVQNLSGRTAAEDSLLKKFRISEPVKTETFKNNILLSTTQVKFKDWGNGLIAPEKISGSIRQLPLEDQALFIAYDRNGNLLEFRNEKQIKETYLWGYNDLYPVAKVIGTGYDNIKNLVDLSLLKNTDGSRTDAAMRNELNKLYTGVPSTGTMISTYTFIPSIGMSSQTDYSRQTLYYEYDQNNRLARVRDNNNDILKQYEYRYGEGSFPSSGGPFSNAAKTGFFYRNSCLPGQVGSLVSYTVAAGTHSSAISQADADRKAQDDINTNGQVYANSNGSCSNSPLPVITYQSAAISRLVKKNDCGGKATIELTYLVPAGKYQSDISQADADRKAESEINMLGQQYANDNGVCIEQLPGPIDYAIYDPNTGSSYNVATYYHALTLQDLCQYFDPSWVPPTPPFFPIPNPVPTPQDPVVQITLAIHTINWSTGNTYSHMQFNSFSQTTLNDFAPDGYYVNKQAPRNVPAAQRIIYQLKDGALFRVIVCQ